jgi:uncharacterized protein
MLGMIVRNLTKGRTLAERAEQASNFVTRGIGLIGRKDWSRSDGLIIRPCNSIHCLFMSLTIDALFVGADDVVRKAVPSIRPWTPWAMASGVRYVIELPAGTIAASGTARGDRLVLESLPNDESSM